MRTTDERRITVYLDTVRTPYTQHSPVQHPDGTVRKVRVSRYVSSGAWADAVSMRIDNDQADQG